MESRWGFVRSGDPSRRRPVILAALMALCNGTAPVPLAPFAQQDFQV